MKSKLSILLLTIVILFSGCQKTETDLTVTLKMSGNLSVHLATSDGTAIPNQKFKLYAGYSYSSSSTSSLEILNTVKTDENGNADFAELNTGSYIIVSQDVKVGNITYNIVKPIQVISGSKTVINIDPAEFVGKLTLSVYTNNQFSTSSGSILVSNANVVLVDATKASDTLTHEEVLALAVVKGKTDANGKVIFEQVPSNREFATYVYFDATKKSWSYYSSSTTLYIVYVNKDEERMSSVEVNYYKLNNITGNLNLKLAYYGYKGGYYNYYDIPNVNVLLVKNSDYYTYNLSYASLSNISQYAVITAQTDVDGYVTFSNLDLSSSYRIYVYYESNKATWYDNSVYANYPLTTSYSTITIDNYSSLGL